MLIGAAMLALALANGGHGAVAVGISSLVVWLTLGALLVSGRLDFGNATRALAVTVGALVLLAALAALSTAWASDDGAAFEDVNRTLLYAGTILLVGLAVRRGGAGPWLAGLALGGTAVALVALGSRLGGFGGDRELALELPLAATRLSYPIGYWNGLGYLMAMTLPCLAYLAGAARIRVSATAVAASVPVVVVLFLTSSRGALIAAAVGIGCVAWLQPQRQRLLTAAALALPAWLIAVGATAARRSHLEPPSDPGLWGIALGAGIAIVAVLVGLAFARFAARDRGPLQVPRLGPVPRVALAALALAVLAALAASAFLGSFRVAGPSGAEAGAGSDSSRSAFWSTAFDAFGDDPLHGTGAGGYPLYWNEHGSLSIPVENAHSEPIESFAELGIPGGLLFLVALLTPPLALLRRLRELSGEYRATAGCVFGVLIGGALAITIDWSWDLPAVAAPFAVCLGLAAARALEPQAAGESVDLVDASFTGYESVRGPARPGPAVLGLGAAALTLAAVCAAFILTLASIQLNVSSDRLAAGDLDGAARAARAAGALEPWSPEPSLQLATIEQAGTNYGSAGREALAAARSSPDDFRSWLVLADVEASLGATEAATAYRARATALAPLVLSRAQAQ